MQRTGGIRGLILDRLFAIQLTNLSARHFRSKSVDNLFGGGDGGRDQAQA